MTTSKKRTAILRLKRLVGLCEKNELYLDKQFVEDGIRGYEFFGTNDFPIYLNEIYQINKSCSFDKVKFLYKKIDKKLEISLSTTINPILNKFIPREAKEQPIFSLHVIPYESYGFVILSWLEQHDSCMDFIKTEFDRNFNKLINYLCFIESEDFYFSIKLYNTSIEKHTAFFKKALFNRLSNEGFRYNDTKIFCDFISV